MAIPISPYIDITTKVPSVDAGERDFSGLVFTKDGMNSGAALNTDYDLGKVVQMTADEISASFPSDSLIANFAPAYFGNGGRYLFVVKVLTADTTAKIAYDRVIGEFQNFGSFTFLGNDWTNGTGTNGGLVQVATENANNGYAFIRPTTASARATDSAAFFGIVGTHIVQGVDTEIGDDVDANLSAAAVMGWYSSVDYNSSGASSSPDYKNLTGIDVTVDSLSNKTTCDGLRVNYVGLVQGHGFRRQFYQTGVNMDGVDLGVFRDSMWIKGSVEAGWFNLVESVGKIPASSKGRAMVESMIVGVAENGCTNGVILLNKPLDATQRAIVNSYANGVDASVSVMTTGYYIGTQIIRNGEKYELHYTLIYGKGDHISRVVGTHVLV